MRLRHATARVLLVIVLTATSAPAFAQSESTTPRKDGELPVSLERIRRELAQHVRTTESRDGMRLSYYVEVYGTAPRLQLFTPGENISTAPVQYGGMTHQEFLSVVTPQEFKSPAADIPAAIAALVKWAVEKKKNSEPKR